MALLLVAGVWCGSGNDRDSGSGSDSGSVSGSVSVSVTDSNSACGICRGIGSGGGKISDSSNSDTVMAVLNGFFHIYEVVFSRGIHCLSSLSSS